MVLGEDASRAGGLGDGPAPWRERLLGAACWGVILAVLVVVIATHGAPHARVGALPGNAPPREALAGIVILAAIVAAIGAPVLRRLIARRRAGELAFAYAPALPGDAARGAYLESFTIYLAGFILLSIVVAWWSPGGGLGGTWWCYAIVPVALLQPRWRGARWEVLRQAIGWQRGRGWLEEIGAGWHGYVAGFPLLGLAILASGLLVLLLGQASHPAFDQVARGDGGRLTLYLLGCVAAPLVEETMFRGVLQHHLRHAHGRWASALVSALLFACIHPQGLAALPVLTALAVVLSWIREWRGSLIASMTAHATNNAIAITLALLQAGPSRA